VFFAILFGVYPKVVLQYMDATIDQQTRTLALDSGVVTEPIEKEMVELARDRSEPTVGAIADVREPSGTQVPLQVIRPTNSRSTNTRSVTN
jgi:hypothetical protein